SERGLRIHLITQATLAASAWRPIHKTTSANTLTPAAKVSVGVTIFFGKPPKCERFGICKITLGGGVANYRSLDSHLHFIGRSAVHFYLDIYFATPDQAARNQGVELIQTWKHRLHSRKLNLSVCSLDLYGKC